MPARRQVDDRKPPVAEMNARLGILPGAGVVRTPMSDGMRHPPERIDRDRPAGEQAYNSAHATSSSEPTAPGAM
jgi:hypothetical protein